MSYNKTLFLCLGVCLLFFSVALAQQATVTGIVYDDTKAVMPGVTVTITNQDTQIVRTAISNDTGNYTVPGLAPGTYRIEAELEGFRKYVNADVGLAVNQVARIDITLSIGQIEQEVHVVGEAPVINTESAEKGSVIYNEELVDLPIESREFFELAFMTAGVMPQQEGGQGGQFSVNGSRLDGMNYIVDGGSNNIMRAGDAVVRTPIDAIGEFKVQTSNYSAEYGRRSTGVINVVLKSGTNAYHGTLFEFHRNSFFDSANFFDPVRYTDPEGNIVGEDCDGCEYYDKDQSVLIRNNYGGNFGGPILKDRMFFFTNFEGMRRREGQVRYSAVPDKDRLNGIFPKNVRNPYDLKKEGRWNTYGFFPDKTIPRDLWHPTSVALLDWIPAPNTDRSAGNFLSQKVDADDWDDYTLKYDWHFFDADNISVRWLYNKRYNDQPFNGSELPRFGAFGNLNFSLVGVTFTHTFSPNVINQLLLNFSRKNNDFWSYNAGTDYCDVLGIASNPSSDTTCTTNPEFFGFPRINFNEYDQFGDANNRPMKWTENDYNLNNTTTVISGEHNLKFGGEFLFTQFWQLHQQQSRGQFNFRTHRRNNKSGRRTGDQWGDFLLGLIDQSLVRAKPMRNYLITKSLAGFFQDDWKVTPNLTMNIGVRYDLFIPPHDKRDQWANFSPELNQLVIAGEPGHVEIGPEQEDWVVWGQDLNYPRSLIFSDRNNIAPRIGFAWRPFSSRTVLRFGVGQFFGLSIINPIRGSLGVNPPFSIQEIHRRDDNDPFHLTWEDPFPLVSDIGDIESPQGYELRPPSGNLYQYNFTIEHQFGKGVVTELGYVGSKGTHLGRQWNLNQWSYTPGNCNGVVVDGPIADTCKVPEEGEPGPDNVRLIRPINVASGLDYDNVNYYHFEADSSYHAFQASVRKRGRDSNLRINYTLSKSIDDSSRLSGGGGNNQQTYAGVMDIYNRDLERALSDFDRRHAISSSFLYKLPFRENAFARGWQLNTIFRYYSGTPISPRFSGVTWADGESPRPDRVGDGSLENPTADRWFDIYPEAYQEDCYDDPASCPNGLGSFPMVPVGAWRYGTAGRNLITGPDRTYLSFSVMRNFRMPAEGHNLQFRWEVFNVPNFVNLQRIEEDIDETYVGTAEQAYPARQMQIALKYTF